MLTAIANVNTTSTIRLLTAGTTSLPPSLGHHFAPLHASTSGFDHIVVPVLIIVGVLRTPLAVSALATIPAVLVSQLLRSLSLGFSYPLGQHQDLLFVAGELGHLLANDALNALQELDIVLRGERDGLSSPARSCCSPDSVDVVLAMSWNVIIYDVVDEGDIETSRGDVCRDKNGASARFELVQGTEAV